jgi:glycolate oxidase FAD binding subunit
MMTYDALYRQLEAVVGHESVHTDDGSCTQYAVQQRQPRLVVQPETVEQAAEIVAIAGRERFAVAPWGQGTHMHLGQTPTRYDVALSLARLTRVIDYDMANLTLIAEAGLQLNHVYRLTAPWNQFLPLGYAQTAASLGGLVATNTSGVKRLRYGGVRDLLLGLRVALPDGSLARFGGRVVKNVAGYDMNKLFIGSLGAFGVILETTYRLTSSPEDDRVLAVVFPTLTQATAAVAAIGATPLLPSAILLLPADVVTAWAQALSLTVQSSQIALLVNYDGTRTAVARQLHDSRALCQAQGGVLDTILEPATLPTLWALREAWCQVLSTTESPTLRLRLGVTPAQLAATITQLAQTPTFCQRSIAWVADASHGQLWAHLTLVSPLTGDLSRAVQAWIEALRTQLRSHHGYVVVESAPDALRQQLDVWGQPPGSHLLALYKQRFDPYGVLNPGRYVAGL